ncbi:hypothetical protein KIW84_010115 [Lathyrus oleraceus]|uniref:Retrotransposon gag domain-containing protein n=1 Tax=Pisum sativum TaxID=3888 RepID=A0A9D4YL87_PEA|nr:hypothetical protein KIW84_010115 [Pisum sativum]
METGIDKPYMFLPSAKDVWKVVKETYSDIQNSSQIFDLKSKLWHTKQCDMSVTTYYNEFLTLWKELDLCYDDNLRCIEDGVLFHKRQENDRVFMFLIGLNKDLDEVRGLALATRNLDEGRRSYKVPLYDHCKRDGIHVKLVRSSKANLITGRRKMVMHFKLVILIKGGTPPSQLPLTTEQLDRLYKLLESLTPSCSIATKGNSAFLSASPNHTWIVYSANHMTGFELGEDDWQC